MAMSLGFKKPWINGMKYYIDQFCVRTQMQGRGAGSYFLRLMEEEIRTSGMNAILLNTEHGAPAGKVLPEKRICSDGRAGHNGKGNIIP